MATAAPEAAPCVSLVHSQRMIHEGSLLNKSLTSIEWLNELEPSSLLGHDSTSGSHLRKRPATPQDTEESTKRRKVPVSTGTTPPALRKPPFSYATLIAFAINSGPGHKMTLSQIYEWIETNFPYFTTAKSAWKNSIRHNLSLRDTFVREKRSAYDQGKGSYWMIRPGDEEKVRQTTLRELRQQQSVGPIEINPQYQGNGLAKIAPLLPQTSFLPQTVPFGHSYGQMINQPHAFFTIPVPMDVATMRPKERVILPKGPVQVVFYPPEESNKEISKLKIIGSAAEGVVNDHSYCSSPMQCKIEPQHYLNDDIAIEQPDPYFGDFLSDLNTRTSPMFVRSTPTKQISPNFLSPEQSPEDDIGNECNDLNNSEGFAPSGLISTPWKNELVSFDLTSFPNTPIRTGLTPTKGIMDIDDLGSLKVFGLPGLTPLKSSNEPGNDSLDVSGLERLLEI